MIMILANFILVTGLSFTEFEEPIAVAVNSRGDVIVADNGSPKLIVYDSQVRFRSTFYSLSSRHFLNNKKKIENSLNFLRGGEKIRVTIFHLRRLD